MTAWEQTPGALLRAGTAGARALATIPGRDDTRPSAARHPDAAAEYRAAWGDSRWAFAATWHEDGEEKHGVQHVDNAGVRAEQRRLAEQGPPIGWCDFPRLGLPPAELAPLYAAAVAGTARTGVWDTSGPDAEYEAMIRERDYARTTWAGR
jgi:hypothetical protein